MGLPIKQLAISTNRNDILTRFFETGSMTPETVEPSLSPSMDIQISSNFERYLFDLMGRNSDTLNTIMAKFKDTGSFAIHEDSMEDARVQFRAFRANDEQTLNVIKGVYEETGYVLDPHTAVGMRGAQFLAKKFGYKDSAPVVGLACAHPAKFPDAVVKACGVHPALPDHLSDLFDRKEHVDVMPNDLDAVKAFVKNN